MEELQARRRSINERLNALLFPSLDNSHCWTTHEAPRTVKLRWNPVSIGTSIWYSTDYNAGERGMVEFCTKSNKTKRIVPYPPNIEPYDHALCLYQQTKIIIVDGVNGKLILFDPTPDVTNQQSEFLVAGYLHRHHSSFPFELFSLCLTYYHITATHFEELYIQHTAERQRNSVLCSPQMHKLGHQLCCVATEDDLFIFPSKRKRMWRLAIQKHHLPLQFGRCQEYDDKMQRR